MSHPLFERHRALLDQALKAIAERGYWSAFPESPSPKVYGEGAAEAGTAAFDALKDKPFPLEQPGTVGMVGGEKSPYGFALGITYPPCVCHGLEVYGCQKPSSSPNEAVAEQPTCHDRAGRVSSSRSAIYAVLTCPLEWSWHRTGAPKGT